MTALPTREPFAASHPDEALAAPPPDVQVLLDSHGAALPLYFDAQRAEAVRRSRTNWPGLWQQQPRAEP